MCHSINISCVHYLCLLRFTFLIIFEGNKNGIFPGKNIPFIQEIFLSNFITYHDDPNFEQMTYKLQYILRHLLASEKPKMANLITVIY